MTNSTIALNTNSRPRWIPIIITSLLVIAIAAWGAVAPESAAGGLMTAAMWVSTNLGWYYMATAAIVLVFILWIAISRHGRTRLGPSDSRPRYGTFTWASMVFASGIGIDVMFYSVAEPVANYYQPPAGAGETAEAAHQAVVWTIFHYGVVGWAVYALVGLCFAYYTHRFGAPLSFRSVLLPVFGKRMPHVASDGINVAAILGTIIGTAMMLGIGVVQLSFGLQLVLGVEGGTATQVSLIALAVVATALSAISGIDKGIKKLSQINVVLVIALAAFVLFTGRTTFVLESAVTNAGTFVTSLGDMLTNMHPYGDAGAWLGEWTLFFWAWWIAVAPIVGVFLARISRGRTIRQFVIGCLSLPFGFIFMFMVIFGNTALDIVTGGNDEFGELVAESPEQGFYTLLDAFPLGTVLILIATLIGLLLYVTSADSAALITSNLFSRVQNVDDDGSPVLRVYFAVLTGLLTLTLLLAGGLEVLQGAVLILGLPFSAVLYILMIGLVKSLRAESQGLIVPGLAEYSPERTPDR